MSVQTLLQVYPVTLQGSPAYDNYLYLFLCEAIHEAFDEAGHPKWLISTATSINPDKIQNQKGFDVVSRYTEYVS